MNEFKIIETFFNSQKIKRNDVIVGIGDDCAVVQIPTDQSLTITTDTLVEGIHFLPNTSAYDIGYKSLAVNLSDLAAKGAEPAWITLALTLPRDDVSWLKDFSHGLFELAERFNVQLIGGDLTKGPLTITIQAIGYTPTNSAILRSNAKPDDLIYVTHTLGDAALGLACLKNTINIENNSFFVNKLNKPEPQIIIGKKLRDIANASIDISDGLAADLLHILAMSHVGAVVDVDKIPLSKAMLASVSLEEAISFALNGGDDYELCFTIPPEKEKLLDFDCHCIGKITEITGLDLRYQNEKKYNGALSGYKHFY